MDKPETQDGAHHKAKLFSSEWVFCKPIGDVTVTLSIFIKCLWHKHLKRTLVAGGRINQNLQCIKKKKNHELPQMVHVSGGFKHSNVCLSDFLYDYFVF